jgi:putative (di)nucleoside polyphosphate hydrolase
MAPETIAFVRDLMPYRDCAGIALFNRKGQVFIGRRKAKGDPDASAQHDAPWQMPQGGIDKGEAPLDTARRELYEETSITSIELLAEAPDWVQYDLPDDLLGVAFKGKYRGQRQRWFAFLFTGNEGEINVLTPGGGNFHAEFEDWRWADLTETPDLIVPFKRGAYREIVAAFADIPARLRHG